MEKLKLTKDEKHILFSASGRRTATPETIGRARFSYAAFQLQDKGLVTIESDLHGVAEARLTKKGAAYMELNPKLRNPFPWETVMRAATIIAAVAASLALVVGCCRILLSA